MEVLLGTETSVPEPSDQTSDFVRENTPPILSTALAILTVNGMVVKSKMQDVLRNASCCTDIKAYVQTQTG
eukprot:4145665-Ditylum_brightwellii.AAC.1